MRIISALVFLLVNFCLFQANADDALEIPQEELARESVLPRFDVPDNVRHRNVVTEKHLEFSGYLGWNFTEPIYNQTKIGASVAYHFSELSAVNVNFAKWLSGKNSQYVPEIEKKGVLDFNRIPNLEWSLWGHYEMKNYYGKISFTKQGVMNLLLYPLVGAGVTKYTHKMYPGVVAGLGQKFYFSKTTALRIDFKLQYQQGPNPFLKDGLKTSNPSPDYGVFEDKYSLDTVMDVGVSYLF